jgi:hypothetical protein
MQEKAWNPSKVSTFCCFALSKIKHHVQKEVQVPLHRILNYTIATAAHYHVVHLFLPHLYNYPNWSNATLDSYIECIDDYCFLPTLQRVTHGWPAIYE